MNQDEGECPGVDVEQTVVSGLYLFGGLVFGAREGEVPEESLGMGQELKLALLAEDGWDVDLVARVGAAVLLDEVIINGSSV